MIQVKKLKEAYMICYSRSAGPESYEMTKYDLEYYEIGQLMGGN